MALSYNDKAMIALNRFGLGMSSKLAEQDLKQLAADPKNALLSEAAQIDVSVDKSSRFVGRDLALYSYQATLKKKAVEAEMQKMQPEPLSAKPFSVIEQHTQKQPVMSEPVVIIHNEALSLRLKHAAAVPYGFAERWVAFFSNHFCISSDKNQFVRALAGAYEREAIREHAFGSFQAMLTAAIKHPAMLIYLDNSVSIGTNSTIGLRRKSGLNENLAREILELHTLGVNGGYSQSDVIELAKIITGWRSYSVAEIAKSPNLYYDFVFDAQRHEKGTKTLLLKTYKQGEKEGERALEDLATLPSTAKFIATKLVKHFISDNPSPSLIQKLQNDFMKTGGDLKSLATVLLTAPESYEPSMMKVRTPQEWLMAVMRGTDISIDVRKMIGYANLLGQPYWRPPSPKGFSDENATWLTGIATRFDIATLIAKTIKIDGQQGSSPLPFAEKILGSSMSAKTRETISRAESFQQGAAITLLSPEMLRR